MTEIDFKMRPVAWGIYFQLTLERRRVALCLMVAAAELVGIYTREQAERALEWPLIENY